MTITLRNDVERDVGRVVVFEKDGEEIGRMSMKDFLASSPVAYARDGWLVEQHGAAERVRFTEQGADHLGDLDLDPPRRSATA